MGIKSAAQGSWFPKAAVACILLALLLHLIGMGAPNWASTNPRLTMRNEHIGLWRYCAKPYGSSSSVCDDFINIITGDWLKAAQSFSILGLCALIAAVAMTVVYAFVPDMEGEIKVLGATIGSLAASALTILICVAVFGGEYQQHFNERERGIWKDVAMLDWAFGVAVAGGVLTCVSLGFMIAELLDVLRDTV